MTADAFSSLIKLAKAGIGALLIAFGVNQTAQAASIINPANGHYYEYVPGSFTWTDAKAAAESRTFKDQQGYLATITSAVEHEFIISNFEVPHWTGWIGASDAETEGTWKWITGPEAGTIFLKDGNQLSYSNFIPGEPNNASAREPGNNVVGDEDNVVGDEDYAHLWASRLGMWNDLPNNAEDWAWKHSIEATNVGYYVEYGSNSTTSVPEPATAIGLVIAIAARTLSKKRLT